MLPTIVYQMCVHGALIVGSGAKVLVDGLTIVPKDYDLLVPPDKWQTIALLIPKEAVLNKFGGWKFTTCSEGAKYEVDVWPDTLRNYLERCKTKHGGYVYAVDYISNKVYGCKTMALFHPWEKHAEKSKTDPDVAF